ncbi:ABC transporter substrate-binding protein [Oceanomicrobium pacificus]|uniref:Probable sugar-binding periplasmic protein n=1 Tax=Oceanomicrobium pacificus TaxID=2692916 RepID=A0A6B0TTA0_9RHOB|nr:ABC transporter substrate-binding protein [Oceanomicrobium pacificus]MXU65999.1 extracellular solute-binding protein [Oceanomicrobium pacificus]
MKLRSLAAAFAATALVPMSAQAVDLEVTHWWTSGGEAAAVSEFAKAFDATEHNWVDGAIAGSGGTARPIIISRILGGDPMGATQLNHGRQAEELIEAGLLLDLTDVAEAEGWKDIVNPSSLLDACTLDGRIYCAPVNIHSWQWIWLSHKAFADAGVDVPSNWDEFVAAAPALEEAGKIPLAMGQQPWQSSGAFGVLSIAIAGVDAWKSVNIDKDAEVAGGPVYAKVFEAAAKAREFAANSNVQDWNQATNLVITGQAGAQIMGDWAQGEFQVAEQVAGEDYTCLPGLGVNEILDTAGDAFYFPKIDDPEVEAAQKELAALLLSPEVQVNFNLKKGSLPIRGDIDLSAANDCMKKGLEILASGNIMPSGDMALTPDTQGQIEDLMVEFWNDPSYSAEDAQARYAEIIGDAD